MAALVRDVAFELKDMDADSSPSECTDRAVESC